jgi:exonuclease VII large subunit
MKSQHPHHPQAPSFRERLDRGCFTQEECEQLIEDANDRVRNCRIKYTCDAYKKDHKEAVDLSYELERKIAEQKRIERQRAGEQRRAEEQREREEQQRQRKEEYAEQERQIEESIATEKAEKDEKEARLEELRHKAKVKEYAIPVIRAIICDLKDTIEAYKDDLRRERRLEKKSGVIDLRNRRSIVESIDMYEDKIKDWKVLLKRGHGVAAQKCGDQYKRIMECRTRVVNYPQGGQGSVQFTPEERERIFKGQATTTEIMNEHEQKGLCEEPLQTYADIWNHVKNYLW